MSAHYLWLLLPVAVVALSFGRPFTRLRDLALVCGQIVLVAVMSFPLLGYLRGPEMDLRLSSKYGHVHESAVAGLTKVTASTEAASGVLVLIQFALAGLFALIGCWLLSRIPGLSGSIVLNELRRQRGSRWARLRLWMGLSMPAALAAAVFLHGSASIYAWAWFCFAFAVVRLSHDPEHLSEDIDHVFVTPRHVESN